MASHQSEYRQFIRLSLRGGSKPGQRSVESHSASGRRAALQLTQDSRSAISRGRFFLDRAAAVPPDGRVEFEAFLEAAIVFSRAAVHRLKTTHDKQPGWKAWWDSILNDPAVHFFRTERDWILKEAPPKIGQKLFLPSIGPAGSHVAVYLPARASEMYYFDDPATPATDTVRQHLDHLAQLLKMRLGTSHKNAPGTSGARERCR
jgi:hypothetical protein